MCVCVCVCVCAVCVSLSVSGLLGGGTRLVVVRPLHLFDLCLTPSHKAVGASGHGNELYQTSADTVRGESLLKRALSRALLRQHLSEV